MGGWGVDGPWGIVLVGGLVLGWTLYLDLRHDHDARLARRWVHRARPQGRWAGPVAFAGSLALLLGYVVLALLGSALGSAAGDRRWALVVALPAMLAYAPFVLATMPVQYGGYRSWRRELAEAGADRRLQRAIAWWAGPPSLLGLVAMVATLIPLFTD